MAIEKTPRLGLPKYTSGSDLHPNRTEFNALQDLLEGQVAISAQGTLAERPSAGVKNRIYWATDSARAYFDDGTQWLDINTNGGGGAGKEIVVAGTASEGTSARAARADHTHNLQLVTGSRDGAMRATDKALLDAATNSPTGNTLAKRTAAGHLDSPTPTQGTHVANKGYVDGEAAKKSDLAHKHAGEDITSGTISPDRVANATSALDGLMPKADKAKLDAATRWNTKGTLVMRDSEGNFSTFPPKSSDDAANKGYVDGLAAQRVEWKGDLGGSNPNTVTERGEYYQFSATPINPDNGYPINGAGGALRVVPFGGGSSALMQEWTEWSSNRRWLRSTNDGGKTWRGWTELASTAAATASTDGLMPKADKALLDAATHLPTNGALVRRHPTAGTIQVQTGTTATDAANKGYVDGQIATRSEVGHTHGYADIAFTQLTTEHLDTITSQGIYHQNQNVNATAERGYPVTTAGLLEVHAYGTFVYQRYSSYKGNDRVFYRARYNNVWGGWSEVAIASQKADTGHKHSGADITHGTISPDRIANATVSLDGLMSKADKQLLDYGTSAPTASRLIVRDSAGRARVADPYNVADIATKGYVDTSAATVRSDINRAIEPLQNNAVEHVLQGSVAGPAKPADQPIKHFAGWVNLTQGAGGDNPNATPATDANGFGGVWFGYNGIPKFNGISSIVMTNRAIGDFHAAIAMDTITLERVKFRARRLNNSNWANAYGSFVVYLEIWGW